MAGCKRKVKSLVATLPQSNAYFAKAYPVERLECLLDGIQRAFVYFVALTTRMVLENTSLAVREVLRGPARIENRLFEAFRGALPVGADFCAPREGNEKGLAERGVEYVRGLCFRPLVTVESFEELNGFLLQQLDADLAERRLTDGRTAKEALRAEREGLRPLPAHWPETCRVRSVVADKYAHVRIDHVSYSVPSELVLDARHILRVLEHKHRATPESTAIQQWELPEVFERLHEALAARTRKPHQKWVRVLRLTEDHALDEVGYVPFDRVGADLLFSFVTRVYERRRLVVTTNLPIGRWSEVFHDATAAAAVIDRIVHHAAVLETDGESCRLKDARRPGSKRRKGVPPQLTRATRERFLPIAGGPFSVRR